MSRTIQTRARERGRPRSGAGPDPLAIERIALTAFATRQFDGASVRDIAKSSGVDPALLSRRYGSKLGLWKSTVDVFAGQAGAVYDQMRVAMATAETPAEGARAALRQFIKFNASNPGLARFLVNELAEPGERCDYVVAAVWRPFIMTLRSILEQSGHEATGSGQLDVVAVMSMAVLPCLIGPVLVSELGIGLSEAGEQVVQSLIQMLDLE